MHEVRPRQLVVVTGTATEVGKTWVTAQLCSRARAAGISVAARKPAQSFEPGDVEAGVTDAQVLAAATGSDPADVCPAHRWYPVAMAPPMAAEVLGRPTVTIADLLEELRWPDPAPALGFVETAGGVRSPLAVDGDTIDVIERLTPDRVVLVADAGLGTINSVLLSLEALHHRIEDDGIEVLLNRFDATDDLHRRNHAWLTDRLGRRVHHDPTTLSNAVTSTFAP